MIATHRPFLAIGLLALTAGVHAHAQAQTQDQAPIAAAELADKARDRLDRVVVVEGREPHFTFRRPQGWDRFQFKNSDVEYRLAPAHAFRMPPSVAALRVKGVLRRSGDLLTVDVTSAPEVIPTDLERLERGVSVLPPEDWKDRDNWARWGEHRAELYQDAPLAARSRSIAADALRLRAGSTPPLTPDAILDLVRQARDRKIAEPEPSALVHRAARDLMEKTREAGAIEALASRVESLLGPEARSPQDAAIDPLLAGYGSDPAATYRSAAIPARAALDRKLLADLRQKSFEARVASDPAGALALADAAAAALPDRPAFVKELRNRALETSDVTKLRLQDVQARSKLYEQMGEPEQAKALLRRWLDDRRTRLLSPNDAEGRIDLAAQYESMLNDTAIADQLLREAWALDSQSEATSQEFLKRGYRLVDREWRAPPSRSVAGSEATQSKAPARSEETDDPTADTFKGLTRHELLERMGKPDVITRRSTQGQYVEQWIYLRRGNQKLYINLRQRAGMPRPVVVSSNRSD